MTPESTSAAPEWTREVERHRRYLLRIAHLQLRDRDSAEDVVQETLVAALAGGAYAGKSSVRTWLTGILKHKIVDVIRRRQRDAIPLARLAADDGDTEEGDS